MKNTLLEEKCQSPPEAWTVRGGFEIRSRDRLLSFLSNVTGENLGENDPITLTSSEVPTALKFYEDRVDVHVNKVESSSKQENNSYNRPKEVIKSFEYVFLLSDMTDDIRRMLTKQRDRNSRRIAHHIQAMLRNLRSGISDVCYCY